MSRTEQSTKPAGEPSRLARRLGTADAVVVGLGSMIGAGVFAAIAPAAAAAGTGLLLGLLLAAAIAYCNAISSAQLAALYPESGGAYVYGNRRLGRFWGFLAGWGFVVGKVASCAAMALTFGFYAAPQFAQPLAVGAVVALTTVNYLGIERTALSSRLSQSLLPLRSLEGKPMRKESGRSRYPAPTEFCRQPVCCSLPLPAMPGSLRSVRKLSSPRRPFPARFRSRWASRCWCTRQLPWALSLRWMRRSWPNPRRRWWSRWGGATWLF
ncbi:APC family permease [Variovorax paradoxus]|nr:APC family permease [Variovorax paradoxus]